MTISTTTRKAGPYTGNGTTASFPFAFKVFTAADVYVVRTSASLGTDTVLALTTDYTVTLNANQDASPGGTVTLTGGTLATGYSLTITSNVEAKQPTDLTNQGGFFPRVVTNALDRLTILVQQLAEQVGRSLKVSVSTPAGVATTLPAPASNKLIGWNEAGNNLQNVDPITLASIVAFATSTVDLFTGNGSTTQFALSANPGALANLDVSIGGIDQRAGIDYTWSGGTVLTFTTAPPTAPVGAVDPRNISVKYKQALPQGYADAAATFWIDNGGTSRDVQATLKRLTGDVISLKDPRFGVKADGSDDAAAIQAAMNAAAASGALLVSPAKATYVIGSSLTVPSGLLADFAFSTIKRKPGSVFNMLANTGGSGIKIWNLVVDGNRQADGRVATNVGDRFGGVVLNSVTSSELRNVTANNTVNAEDGRAGVYLVGCSRVDLYNVGGFSNDRSCVYIENSSFVRIFGSYTANNLGSGVTSQNSDDCEYYDCLAISSGYSGISINGKRNKAARLRATGTAAGYAGVNIGHDDALNRADDSIIENVHSYDNLGWGVNVSGAARVQLRGLYLKGNGSHNLTINSNSTACTVSGITSTLAGSSGIIIQSGKGHKILSGEVFGNAFYGIDVETGCSATIGTDVRVYNNCTADNTLAGVLLNGAADCTVGAECYDDQGTKTQGYGVWLVGGSGNMLTGYLHDLKTAPIRESSSPVYTTRNMRTGNNSMSGSFTPGAGVTSVTVNNNNARAGMLVMFYPANAAGRSLGTPTLGTVTAGTSFVANLGGSAAGTEAYGYVIL